MSVPRLVDTHCHLVLPEMAGDLAAVLERARHAGVKAVVVPGVDVESSRRAVALAEATPGVYAAVGLHPHYAAAWSARARLELKAAAASPRVVAIGEIGLDHYRNLAPQDAQLAAFRGQLELAGELERPVIVHSREALGDVLAAVEAWLTVRPDGNGRPGGVLHAYAGGLDDARRAIGMGLMLGVAGPITYPKADRLGQTLAGVPLSSLVVETDAPYLAPAPLRGRRNEPAHVALVAAGLATALQREPAEIEAATTANAARLFGWKDEHTDRDLL
jgi:TatD DNase family protein